MTTQQSDDEASGLENWEIRSTDLLPLILDTHKPDVVELVWVSSMVNLIFPTH